MSQTTSRSLLTHGIPVAKRPKRSRKAIVSIAYFVVPLAIGFGLLQFLQRAPLRDLPFDTPAAFYPNIDYSGCAGRAEAVVLGETVWPPLAAILGEQLRAKHPPAGRRK